MNGAPPYPAPAETGQGGTPIPVSADISRPRHGTAAGALPYRRDIDGLRALAVAPVVLFHAGVPGAAGGFVGVDIFFVISGWLICSIIAGELAAGNFSLARFYERRCRRILPALFAMMIVVSALAAAILLPRDMAAFARSALATGFFVSNVHFWQQNNYFDTPSQLKPLLHTWSLGIEEQFYILVPLAMMIVARWLGGRQALWLGLAAAVSFGFSAVAVGIGPSSTFYLLPGRFWELALGAVTALALSRFAPARWVRETTAAAGLALVLWSVATYSEETSFPGPSALPPCLGAAMMLWTGAGGSAVSRVLGLRPFVLVGRISYPLYLWHWPLLALSLYALGRPLEPWEAVLAVGVAACASVLSYRLVETPFRRPATGRWRVFAASGLGAVLAAVIAIGALATDGYRFRYPDVALSGPEPAAANSLGTCFLDSPMTFGDWSGDKCFVSRGRGPRVLLWGDSFATHYAGGLIAARTRLPVDILVYTASACPPVLGYYSAGRPNCRDFNDNVFDVIRRYHIETVVMAARWEMMIKRGVSTDRVGDTVRALAAHGVQVYVIGQSPVFTNNVQVMFVRSGLPASTPAAYGRLSFPADLNARLARGIPPRSFIDPLAYLCRGRDCLYRKDGEFLFFDEGHLSAAGARLAVGLYFPFRPVP